MFMNVTLQRPLAIIDLETTGREPHIDRIVEISVLKIFPGGQTEQRTRRINPEMPIPPEASAVHGIRDEDVAGEPRFSQLAASLLAFLDGCDLCGYNIKRYDLRVLHAEFARAGLTLPLAGRAVIDPLEIFHTRERRDLTAAVQFYCARDHAGAHGAAADVLATAAVLDAMMTRYSDLPRTIADLHENFRQPVPVDSKGCFTRDKDQFVFAFGKHEGRPVDDVAQEARDYLEWILEAAFPDDTKAVVRSVLSRFPAPTTPSVPAPQANGSARPLPVPERLETCDGPLQEGGLPNAS